MKFVITQKALAEGWDCPSAYVLVGLASLQSSTAVEQVLGRILRQPDAVHRDAPALNQSYAFVHSRDFARTAEELRDRLVSGAGFDRKEVKDFVVAARTEQARFDLKGPGRIVMTPVEVPLAASPDLKAAPKELRDKLSWDPKRQTLTLDAPLSEDETAVLLAAVAEPARAAIAQAAHVSRTTAIEFFQTPAELGLRLQVPQLALRVQGELQLFDDPEALDYPWDLSVYDAAPTHDDLSALGQAGRVEGGELDIDEAGKVKVRFIAALQRDLGLSYQPEHWNPVRLAAWLCRNLPERRSPTPASRRSSRPGCARCWSGRGSTWPAPTR